MARDRHNDGAGLDGPRRPPTPVLSIAIDKTYSRQHTMYGSGCPIGSGGMVREMRNNTPVFLFPDWGLSLANGAEANGSVSKFCTEEISWAMRHRAIKSASPPSPLEGMPIWSRESLIGVGVEMRFGNESAGVRCVPYPLLPFCVFAR